MAILRTTIVDYREFSMLFKDDAIQRKMPLKLPHIQCFASKCPCKLGFWLSITTVVFEPNSKSYLCAEGCFLLTPHQSCSKSPVLCLYSTSIPQVNWPQREEKKGELRCVFHFGKIYIHILDSIIMTL